MTWFDEQENVVWLCACALHRSGQPDDAFPYFRGLQASGRIWPEDEDYVALAGDRGEQFAAFVLEDAPRLLAIARKAPGTEQVLVIGREPVAAVVHVVETLEETFVAVSGRTLTPPQLLSLFVALYPDSGYDEWQFEERLPTRELDHERTELCFSIVHG